MAPFQAGLTRVVAVDYQLWDHDVFLKEIHSHLMQAQSLMKLQHDIQGESP
jgi:hypothetical protein